MANYTTGAQRYNKRMDKIMDNWRENCKKYPQKCQICGKKEDEDGRCGCTNKDAN